MKHPRSIFIFLLFCLSFYIKNPFAQPNWYNTFIHSANQIVTILSNDGINFFAFSSNSQTYLKSTDGGVIWISIDGFDSSYTFTAGQFVNSTTGWIGGINTDHSTGQLFKTTNSGINWVKQTLPLGIFQISCMEFVDENTGWLGAWGSPAKIMKTTNSGNSWMFTEIQNGYHIGGIQFVNSNTGWASVGSPTSKVLKTTNQGINWNNVSISSPQLTNISNLYAVDTNTCWVINNSLIGSIKYTYFYKTTNSGSNWDLISTYSSPQTSFNKLVFRNSQTGYAYSGANIILKSTNSGVNWSSLTNPYPTAYLNDIYFEDDNVMLAAGGSVTGAPYNNYILKSTNAGINWILKNHNRDYTFYLLKFVDGNTGFAVADTGRVFKTTNYGGEWILNHIDTTFVIKSIAFKNVNGIFSGYNGKIKRTSNSGMSWQLLNTPTTQTINQVCFTDQNNCWAVGNNDVVMNSTNAGLNWINCSLNQPKIYNLLDVCFMNNATGWVMGFWQTNNPYPFPNDYETAIFKTTNTGLNWSKISSWLNYNDWSYNNFKFLNDNVGFVYKHGGLLKTTNAGNSWFSLPNFGNFEFILKDVSFLDGNTFWVGGYDAGENGLLFKTSTGGSNWQRQFYFEGYPRQKIMTVSAVDTNKIMFGGDYSNIFATTNGGGVIGLSQIGNTVPKIFELFQNYPNPFNPSTKIRFELPKAGMVNIAVYDILGKEVYLLVNEYLQPAKYEVNWNAEDMPSGVYFCKMETEGFIDTKKMILVK